MTALERLGARWHALTGGHVAATGGGGAWAVALVSDTIVPQGKRYHRGKALADAIASANLFLDGWAK